MERWSIRESVQKVKFFFLPLIRSDRFEWWIERSNGTRSSFVKRLKSIRSNEFNLDSTLDESDSIWIWFVLLRKTFEWPFRILIPNDTRLLWNEKDRGYIFLSIINSLNFVLPFLFFFWEKNFKTSREANAKGDEKNRCSRLGTSEGCSGGAHFFEEILSFGRNSSRLGTARRKKRKKWQNQG